MSRRILFLAVAAALSSAGCAGVLARPDPDRLPAGALITSAVLAEPDLHAAPSLVMPAVSDTMLANGVLWVGYNASTVEGGDLAYYNSGEGYSISLCIGNGEDPKNFFEVMAMSSTNHLAYGGPASADPVIGDAHHEATYLGAKRYLLPLEGKPGSVVMYATVGLAWHSLNNMVDGDPSLEESQVSSARGVGAYVGTGIEVSFGDKRQVALGFDMRASYWNWEGRPFDTGQQGTVASSVALVFHY
jgi:hypothetical protein